MHGAGKVNRVNDRHKSIKIEDIALHTLIFKSTK